MKSGPLHLRLQSLEIASCLVLLECLSGSQVKANALSLIFVCVHQEVTTTLDVCSFFLLIGSGLHRSSYCLTSIKAMAARSRRERRRRREDSHDDDDDDDDDDDAGTQQQSQRSRRGESPDASGVRPRTHGRKREEVQDAAGRKHRTHGRSREELPDASGRKRRRHGRSREELPDASERRGRKREELSDDAAAQPGLPQGRIRDELRKRSERREGRDVEEAPEEHVPRKRRKTRARQKSLQDILLEQEREQEEWLAAEAAASGKEANPKTHQPGGPSGSDGAGSVPVPDVAVHKAPPRAEVGPAQAAVLVLCYPCTSLTLLALRKLLKVHPSLRLSVPLKDLVCLCFFVDMPSFNPGRSLSLLML